ncbi:MAG: DUF402 domain-containing protein [Anaerolineales bacterium]|nr:MAG: DUF402 domain-containing protein [Anaerolineales bacterium]
MTDIKVLKQNPAGQLMYEWNGQLISYTDHEAVVEALFNAESGQMVDISLSKGDHFLESYYDDRWYNIFEVRDKDDGHLKGWYCNISAPAVITPAQIIFRDFALDLLVYPDGRQVVLDEDEFEALECTTEERRLALQGLAALQAHFRQRFDK